jgi:phosphoglycerate dehydrogenase-like enzyme
VRVLVPEESREIFAEASPKDVLPVFYSYRDIPYAQRLKRKLGRSSAAEDFFACFRPGSADLDDIVAMWLGAAVQLPARHADVLLPQLPSLQWAYVQRTGMEHVAVECFANRAIPLSNAGPLTSRWVAEMIVTGIASHLKRLPEHILLQRRAQWSPVLARGFNEARVGIIGGSGNIGTETAKMCRALGMHVTGTSRQRDFVRSQHPLFHRILHTFEQLPELLGSVDIVVLLVPLTPETRGFFGSEQLRWMKQGSALFNYGRAGLVDEPAVIAALTSRRLSAFYTDFLADQSLLSRLRAARTPGLVLTHNSSAHVRGKVRAAYEQFMHGLTMLHEPAAIPNRIC